MLSAGWQFPGAPAAPALPRQSWHTGSYVCKVCGKKFHHSSSLSKHKSVHKGSTECPLCHAVLSSTTYLKRHLSVLHNVHSDLQAEQAEPDHNLHNP